MDNNQPIGILTQALAALQYGRDSPSTSNEKTIYLADSKNAPYGQKSKERVVALSIKNTDLLLEMNCNSLLLPAMLLLMLFEN
jgi:glutamate racemase